MAIYSFRASIVKRAEGRSSVAAAAYRAGEALVDERTGVTHDYSRKHGVFHAEIRAPEQAPDWVFDREALWNAVEACETRKNSQLAREFTLALPHELSDEERRGLVTQFVDEECVSRGMVADIAIHLPDRDGDQRNHHAHILLTLREITPEGFTRKAREWNDRRGLDHWREAWAETINQSLERAGRPERVDHRTLDAQGEDREPTIHEGKDATAMKREGEMPDVCQENESKRLRNDEREQAEIAASKETQSERNVRLLKKPAPNRMERLRSAIADLRKQDAGNTDLNLIRAQTSEIQRRLYRHQARTQYLGELDQVVKGGFEGVYRDGESARQRYKALSQEDGFNPNKAARRMRNAPEKFGRLKGWSLGFLYRSRARREALATLPILMEKAAKAEYVRAKLTNEADQIGKDRAQADQLKSLKATLKEKGRSDRLPVLRRIQKRARGLTDNEWACLKPADKHLIGEARRMMKSAPCRDHADQLLAASKAKEGVRARLIIKDHGRER